TRTSRLVTSSHSAGLFNASKRSLSQASDALEIISRRKISLFEYSEWVTRCRICLTSAWNERVCLCMVMGAGLGLSETAPQEMGAGTRASRAEPAIIGAAVVPARTALSPCKQLHEQSR